MRRDPVAGGLGYGGVLHYRLDGAPALSPALRLAATAAPGAGAAAGTFDIGLLAGLGWRRAWLPWLATRLEGLAGYEHLTQSARNHTSAFAYLGQGTFELTYGRVAASVAVGVGGRVFQIAGRGWRHHLDVQGLVGVGWRWESGWR